MRNRINLTIITLMVLIVLTPISHAGMTAWYDLPGLMAKSDIIASGIISIKDGIPIFSIDQT
jgi:hypothetical protein